MPEGRFTTTVTVDSDEYRALRIHLFATDGGTFSSWVNQKIAEELERQGYTEKVDVVEEEDENG